MTICSRAISLSRGRPEADRPDIQYFSLEIIQGIVDIRLDAPITGKQNIEPAQDRFGIEWILAQEKSGRNALHCRHGAFSGYTCFRKAYAAPNTVDTLIGRYPENDVAARRYGAGRDANGVLYGMSTGMISTLLIFMMFSFQHVFFNLIYPGVQGFNSETDNILRTGQASEQIPQRGTFPVQHLSRY